MEKSYSESYAAAGVDITAGYRSGTLPVRDVVHLAGDHHNRIDLPGQRLGSRHRAGGGIGRIDAAPARAHPGEGKDFGSIAANGGRFQGKDLMAKPGAERQGAHGNRVQRPGFACRYRTFNSTTHRLGARRGQRANVNQQRIGYRGKLLGLFGLDHHRRRCAKRQQNVGRKGLYDVIGHTMGQRRTGSEVM